MECWSTRVLGSNASLHHSNFCCHLPPPTRSEMQRRDRLIAAVLIVLVFVASTIAYGASVNDPAWEKIVGAGKKEGKVVVFGARRRRQRRLYARVSKKISR